MREEKEFYVWTRLPKKWFISIVSIPIILLFIFLLDVGFYILPQSASDIFEYAALGSLMILLIFFAYHSTLKNRKATLTIENNIITIKTMEFTKTFSVSDIESIHADSMNVNKVPIPLLIVPFIVHRHTTYTNAAFIFYIKNQKKFKLRSSVAELTENEGKPTSLQNAVKTIIDLRNNKSNIG